MTKNLLSVLITGLSELVVNACVLILSGPDLESVPCITDLN